MSINLPLLSNQIDSGPYTNGLPEVNVSCIDYNDFTVDVNISNDMANNIKSSITPSCRSLSINSIIIFLFII